MWAGHGYGSDTNALNILYRERYENGTFSGISTITTDGQDVNKDYRYPALDFDKNGYRHFILESINDGGGIANLWYIQETGGGLQPMVQINTEDNNGLVSLSNILIDQSGRVNIAYCIYDISRNFPMYLKRKPDGGAWTGRITIYPGIASDSGARLEIQSDKYDLLFIVHDSSTNSSPHYIAYKTVNANNVVSQRYYLHIMAANHNGLVTQIPWSNYPVQDSVRINTPQQFIIVVYIDSDTSHYEVGNLMFYADTNVILGAPLRTPEMDKYTYNVRGAFNRTKFNSGFNPSV